MTALIRVAFGLLLAALAVAPSLIGAYLERHGTPSRAPRASEAYPPPLPFGSLPSVSEGPDQPWTEGAVTGEEEDPADWWKDEGGGGV